MEGGSTWSLWESRSIVVIERHHDYRSSTVRDRHAEFKVLGGVARAAKACVSLKAMVKRILLSAQFLWADAGPGSFNLHILCKSAVLMPQHWAGHTHFQRLAFSKLTASALILQDPPETILALMAACMQDFSCTAEVV